MKNRFFIFPPSYFILLFLMLLLGACQEESEPIYESYGLVSKTSAHAFTVLLDDGLLIYPRESCVDPSRLHDSSRIYLQFNILEENDSAAFARITYADTILTKSILPYDESILDSIGQDPVKINRAWIAHDFINIEFLFAGRTNLVPKHAHMVNLLLCPSSGNKLNFEFRHNDFDDEREKIYLGIASFPLEEAVAPLGKPVTISIKYHDSENTSRTIELIYNNLKKQS